MPAPVLVFGGIASVQFGAAVAKGLFATAGPGGTVLLRLLLSAAVMLALARPRLAGRPAPSLRAAALFGLVLACMNLSFYEALDRIPLGVAVTVEFTGPLAVAIGGSRRWADGLWVLLAGLGVLLLTGSGGGALDAVGVALAALAGACWAAYILLAQRVGTLFPGMSGLALALAVGAVVMLPVGVAGAGSALVRPGVLLAGFAVAMLSSVVPYSLELAALRRLPAAVFGVLMSLEPAVAALAGWAILHEGLRPRQLLGIGCVSAASAGVTLRRARRSPRRAGAPLPASDPEPVTVTTGPGGSTAPAGG